MAIRYSNALKKEYGSKWRSMRYKNKGWHKAITRTARKILKNKHRYQEISDLTNGIPWQFIAVIHNRESGLNFSRHLHNGDRLTKRTWRVPAGRPRGNPPFTFEESSVDALKMKGFHKIKDWSIERQAFMLERYNGFGYRYKRIPSPYLWSGSQHYRSGKYVADHKFSRVAVDQQMGVMPLLKRVYELDGESPAQVDQPRKKVDSKDLKKYSRKLRWLSRIKKTVLSIGTSIATFFGFADWAGLQETAQQFQTLLANNVTIILLVLGVSAWFLIEYLENKSKEDYEENRYEPSELSDEPTS